MIEKTANYEYSVYLDPATGTLKMRHPGGRISDYDGRFGPFPPNVDQWIRVVPEDQV